MLRRRRQLALYGRCTAASAVHGSCTCVSCTALVLPSISVPLLYCTHRRLYGGKIQLDTSKCLIKCGDGAEWASILDPHFVW